MPRSKEPEQKSQEQIIDTEYSELMQKSYIDYAMSVIISRALPDIRDGLKPVQRRVLYDMNQLGITSDKPYRKSARIVGDTMGKYHPHGDSSIYDSLVVMAQDFKKMLPLIDGHGNFGTIEGDGAAAMRYTEARLQKLTQESMLADLDKNVVDFMPNFDETEQEPVVLPSMIPHFLINGSEGIAVGMATSTPTHNVKECIDAEICLLDHPESTTADLMKYLKGPDFPTGGIVVNADELPEIYETGQGRIRIRGRLTTEKGKNGHINLIVTEIPYTMIGTGIARFLQDVASLSENKLTSDIVDISNQSSKEGIRIVIELKKDTNVENFKALLFKKTRLEDTFGVNMLAIRDGRPETMSLKAILQANIDFAFEVTRRKYETLLEQEKKRKEIQEGLIKAVNVIDLVIEILRGSKDRAMAKKCLVEGDVTGIRFKSRESRVMASQLQFTDAQADAILDMRLYRLIGLELDALVKQHEETAANIYRYEDILDEKSSMTDVIRMQLQQFSREYGSPRRTEITTEGPVVYVENKPQDIDVYFVMDRFGYAKTVEQSLYERNQEAFEQESRYHFLCLNTGKICMFTNAGTLYTVKNTDLPMGKLRDKGIPIDNISDYSSSAEDILSIVPQEKLSVLRILFVTKQGFVKLVDGSEFNVTRKTVAATKLSEGDSVAAVIPVETTGSVVLQSKNGYFLKFDLEEIPDMKKTAAGVHGMKLSKEDTIESAYVLAPDEQKTVTYHDHTVDLSHLRQAGRGGKGSKK